jgi:hypothetical protein
MNSAAKIFLFEKNWDSFYKSLSCAEAEILGTIQNRSMSASRIAQKRLTPEKVNSISSICLKLSSAGVLKRRDKEYFVGDADLAKFLASQDYAPTLTLETAMQHIENTVYQETIGIFELLEHSGKTVSNGHHAAQKLASVAKQMIQDMWQN